MSDNHKQQSAPGKRAIYWGMLIFFVFTITCLVPEVILRLIDPRGRAQLAMAVGITSKSNYVDDPVLGYKHRDPMYFWDDKEHPPPKKKPAGTKRIFALGDSFVKAHRDIGLENSFYRVAARFLSDRPDASHYEWFHFGISGYCQRQHHELIRRYGPLYHPDIIVVQAYLGNDVGENSRIIVRQLLFRGEGLAISDIYRIPGEKKTSASVVHVITKSSYFARFLVERRAVLARKLGISRCSVILSEVSTNHTLDLMRLPSPPYIGQAWRITEDLVVKIKQESETLKASLMFVLVPKDLQVNKTISERVIRESHLDPAEYDFDQPNRRFGDILARHGVEYLDLTPVFREKIASGAALYAGHFSKEGHRLVGKAISKALIEKGFLR